MKNLFPISSIKELNDKQAMYMTGHPQSYRFNASTGIFNLDGILPLTKKGEAFTIIPIAYRKFRDDILNMGAKNWVEFFFLNRRHQVCALLLHGYSVENLMGVAAKLFYDDAKLYEVALTIRPVQKKNKRTGSTYFIAEFSFEKLNENFLQKMYETVEGYDIFRADTLTGEAETHFQHNFNICRKPLTQHAN